MGVGGGEGLSSWLQRTDECKLVVRGAATAATGGRANKWPRAVGGSPRDRFDDETDDGRQTDDQGSTIITATYESMAAFMRDNGLLKEAYILRRRPSSS